MPAIEIGAIKEFDGGTPCWFCIAAQGRSAMTNPLIRFSIGIGQGPGQAVTLKAAFDGKVAVVTLPLRGDGEGYFPIGIFDLRDGTGTSAAANEPADEGPDTGPGYLKPGGHLMTRLMHDNVPAVDNGRSVGGRRENRRGGTERGKQ